MIDIILLILEKKDISRFYKKLQGGKMVREINQNEFNQILEDKEKINIVDFHATWCNPCKMLAPVLEELDRANENVNIYKIDVDLNAALADQLDISSVPTMLVFKDGKIQKQILGFQPLQSLQTIVDQLK